MYVCVYIYIYILVQCMIISLLTDSLEQFGCDRTAAADA